MFGETTAQIARRLEDCAAGADALVLQGGINDIGRGLDRSAVGRAVANLRGMVEQARSLDLDVAIANVLPWNNGFPEATPLIRELNRGIDRLAQDEGLPVLRFFETLEDPQSPGLMKAEWTADGDHPSIEGYRRLGTLAFKVP